MTAIRSAAALHKMRRPTAQEVRPTIPTSFKYRSELKKPYPPDSHNGATSPARCIYWLIYPVWLPWGRKARRNIRENSYIHDAGYTIFQLLGSPWYLLEQNDWDSIYRDAYISQGHTGIAAIHYWGVHKYGQDAWDKNRRVMEDLYGNWNGYLEAKDLLLSF